MKDASGLTELFRVQTAWRWGCLARRQTTQMRRLDRVLTFWLLKVKKKLSIFWQKTQCLKGRRMHKSGGKFTTTDTARLFSAPLTSLCKIKSTCTQSYRKMTTLMKSNKNLTLLTLKTRLGRWCYFFGLSLVSHGPKRSKSEIILQIKFETRQ